MRHTSIRRQTPDQSCSASKIREDELDFPAVLPPKAYSKPPECVVGQGRPERYFIHDARKLRGSHERKNRITMTGDVMFGLGCIARISKVRYRQSSANADNWYTTVTDPQINACDFQTEQRTEAPGRVCSRRLTFLMCLRCTDTAHFPSFGNSIAKKNSSRKEFDNSFPLCVTNLVWSTLQH